MSKLSSHPLPAPGPGDDDDDSEQFQDEGVQIKVTQVLPWSEGERAGQEACAPAAARPPARPLRLLPAARPPARPRRRPATCATSPPPPPSTCRPTSSSTRSLCTRRTRRWGGGATGFFRRPGGREGFTQAGVAEAQDSGQGAQAGCAGSRHMRLPWSQLQLGQPWVPPRPTSTTQKHNTPLHPSLLGQIFRHMDRCLYRKVLEDNGGVQKVEVAHEVGG